jgi:hypothetical protein
MLAEHLLQRRMSDAAGVVRDGRRSDYQDDFKNFILTESCLRERGDIVIVKAPPFFDQRPGQLRKGCVLAILRRAPLTDGLDVRRIEARPKGKAV